MNEIHSRLEQGERRTVTILFCDVTGSTAMAELLDPEEWAELMDEAFEFLIEPVDRYGGTVARLMGDAILAFFGAPVAHEDDPQRAILAGLEIVRGIQPFCERVRADYGLEFNVRVGINTGSVVVGEIGSELANEYTAMGDAVNLAHRMEATAEPATVQVSGTTHSLVAPLFDFEPLGSIPVKGKREPVPSYRVLGTRARPGRLRGIAGLSAPLTGRADECAALEAAFAGLDAGRGRVVCLIGEAGLGKSRLIEEAHQKWVLGDPQSAVFWIEGRGVSYATARPYGVFLQQLRESCGVADDDPPEIVRSKILTSMGYGPAAADDPSADPLQYRQAMELLLQAGGPGNGSPAAASGEVLQRRLYAAMGVSFRKMASRIPMALVCDDLQWADRASVDLILSLLPLAGSLPILFLAAFRPQRPSPAWDFAAAAREALPDRYEEIHLAPLPPAHSQELAEGLLRVSELPQTLREPILNKAEGNPLFMEEIVRALSERGPAPEPAGSSTWPAAPQAGEAAPDLGIPDTLQGLLAARLDRLDPAHRRTLQIAAVLGRSFGVRVLERMGEAAEALPSHLAALQEAGLIQEEPAAGEQAFRFRHELLREAAYASILLRRRRQYHRQAGEILENLYADRLEPEAYRLAAHFREAGDERRAMDYYVLAGQAAARLFANAEAVEAFHRALEIGRALAGREDGRRGGRDERLKPPLRGARAAGESEERREKRLRRPLREEGGAPVTDDELIDLHTRLGRALELCGEYDRALAVYADLETLSQERTGPAAQAFELAARLAQASIFSIPTVRHDTARGRALSLHCLGLARELGDHRAEARALWNLLLIENFSGGDPPQAVAYGEQALRIAREHGVQEILPYILNDTARAYLNMGQHDLAWAAEEEAQDLFRAAGDLPMLADSLGTQGQGLYNAGQLAAAEATIRKALAVSREAGSLWGQAFTLNTLGMILIETGQFQEAIESFQNAIRLAEEANFAGPQLSARMFLAWIYTRLGDLKTAAVFLPGLEAVSDIKTPFGGYRVLWRPLRALIEGHPAAALAALEPIEETVGEPFTDTFLVPIALFFLSETLLSSGEFERTLRLARQTLATMQTRGERTFKADVLAAAGRAEIGLGDAAGGRRGLEAALAEARDQGSRRSLWQILPPAIEQAEVDGDRERAEALRREAQEVFAYLAENLEEPQLREAFLGLAEVRGFTSISGSKVNK